MSLLAEAERLLVSAKTPAEVQRGACWLARAALEEATRAQLERRGYPVGQASMRSQLACLEIARQDAPQVPRAAKVAWIGLSNASHHHAFELAPTISEVHHLIELVKIVSEPVGSVAGS